MIEISDLDFMISIQNDIQTTVRDIVEREVSQINDEIADAISRAAMNAASEASEEILKAYPFMTENVTSEDIIYEELQVKIEDDIYNNLRRY